MYSLIRRLLFALDAEAAHKLVADQMIALQRIPAALELISSICRPPASASRTLFGLTFPSPIGIAAGFDKNALMVPMLSALGFGFIEVGTVTLHAQPGNPRPRLFRDPKRKALINRLGFNNDGSIAVAERLQFWSAAAKPPLFVNIGKNKDVPLESAAENYAACYEIVAKHANAAVINVSSPNTPGLRDLQDPQHLEKILKAIPRIGPVLVKIAPDLDDTQIAEICDVTKRLADGMVCTNTTMTPDGGLSGQPLFEPSTTVLRKVRKQVGPDYPLIGVGGVFTPDDVREKMSAGANLVQIYTSFVYEGPLLPRRLARA